MCGRYFFDESTAGEIEDELKLERGSVAMMAGDVTPGMSPVVLTAPRIGTGFGEVAGTVEMGPICVYNMFWGMTGRDKKLIINARSESASQKALFSDSVERRRCLMPAAGFYEWDKDKNKVTFFRKDRSPIYLAGFYTLSDNKESFVILTTAANESMIRVHDRMPLMIEKDDVKDWLNNGAAAKEMLTRQMPLLDSHRDYEQLSLF
jgi:putative SOS response-associated peptidase YedK